MTLIDMTATGSPEPRLERVLHVIDAENLLGGSNFTEVEARHCRVAFEAVAPAGAVTQVILATSHHAALPAWFAWPPTVRRLVRSGENGADLALLAVLATERVEQRFDHVVIGSGDGIFAFPAARLQAAGCLVTVVARSEALSRQLRLAAGEIRFIDAASSAMSEPGRIA